MATFLALQCYQCNTMQVKQQKKSSNKWSCAICNEKQSVQRIYARSGLAKDVRKFVQDFNMSRHLKHAQAMRDVFQSIEGEGINSWISAEEDKPLAELEGKLKQSKWSEYLTTQKQNLLPLPISDAYDNVTVVTALPDVPLGKRKQKASPSQPESNSSKFSKTHKAKDESISHTMPSECRAKLASIICRMKKPRHEAGEGSRQGVQDTVRPVSKWATYLEAWDETEPSKHLAAGEDVLSFNGILQTEMNDQIVDEDVHPDFL
eukprot:Gb_35093 [translate_table: standard]